MDRTFFLAIEQLLLSGMADGSVPVHVEGRHVAVFCAGPPHFDTVITVAQRDFSFESDWPVVFGEVPSEQSDLDKWVERLQDRLKAPLSRLRERRADFLMYQIIDLCTDELLDVMRAYTKRLAHIDDALREQGAGLPPSASSEVSTIRLQLAVVTRRLRGLQRVLRNMIDNPDLTTGLSGYFRDVADHLDEALGDTGHLADRCAAIIETYQRALDRGREMVNQQASERLNKTLFVLTVATTVFAPLQFVAGIYGMNFADSSGKPSIPELLWAKGYLYFWCFVVFYLILCIFFSICLFRRLQRRDRKAGMSRQTPLGDTEVGGSRQMSPGVAYVETAEIRRRAPTTAAPTTAAATTAEASTTTKEKEKEREMQTTTTAATCMCEQCIAKGNTMEECTMFGLNCDCVQTTTPEREKEKEREQEEETTEAPTTAAPTTAAVTTAEASTTSKENEKEKERKKEEETTEAPTTAAPTTSATTTVEASTTVKEKEKEKGKETEKEEETTEAPGTAAPRTAATATAAATTAEASTTSKEKEKEKEREKEEETTEA